MRCGVNAKRLSLASILAHSRCLSRSRRSSSSALHTCELAIEYFLHNVIAHMRISTLRLFTVTQCVHTRRKGGVLSEAALSGSHPVPRARCAGYGGAEPHPPFPGVCMSLHLSPTSPHLTPRLSPHPVHSRRAKHFIYEAIAASGRVLVHCNGKGPRHSVSPRLRAQVVHIGQAGSRSLPHLWSCS